MTTTKQSTVGSTVYLMDPTVSPHVVLTLPALKGFSNVGGGKRGKGDASTMDSAGFNEPFGKRIDPPEATGEIVLNKANATHQKLMTLFKKLSQDGRITVVTTHLLENADMFSRIAIMHYGRLIFYGSPGDARSFFHVTALSQMSHVFAQVPLRSGDGRRY